MARTLKDVGFVHLHVHSSYSLLEGGVKVADIVKAAASDRQPALALTDTNNLFGALEFSEKAAGTGIQPIAGLQLTVCFEAPDPMARMPQAACANIVLLAQDETGYGNLLRLASRAYFDGPLGAAPNVAVSALEGNVDGLIGLTGGLTGPLDTCLRAGRVDQAARRLEVLKGAFGEERLYVEVQRHGLDDERAVERELLRLAGRHGRGTRKELATRPTGHERSPAIDFHSTTLPVVMAWWPMMAVSAPVAPTVMSAGLVPLPRMHS